MLSNYVVFCEDPPTFTIKDGMVHVEDRSGKLVFKRVMSIHTFKRSIKKAEDIVLGWEADRRGTVLPLRGKR